MFLILISSSLIAKTTRYYVDDIILTCANSRNCNTLKKLFEAFEAGLYSQENLKVIIQKATHSNNVKSLAYEIKKSKDKTFLNLDVEFKREIRDINIRTSQDINTTALLDFFPFKYGDIFEIEKEKDAIKTIHKFLEEKGFDNNTVKLKYNKIEEYIDITIEVYIGEVITVSDVRLLHEEKVNLKALEDIQRTLSWFIDEPWNRLSFKVAISEISKRLFEEGFYQSKIVELKPLRKGNQIIVGVDVFFGKRYAFNFRGNSILTRSSLLEKIHELAKTNIENLKAASLAREIEKIYETRGVYHNDIKVRVMSGIFQGGGEFNHFFVNIKEGIKIKAEKILFYGNSFFTEKKLTNLFYQKASILAQRNFLDIDYLKRFTEIIKSLYLDNGFIFAEISAPKLHFDDAKKNVKIHYEIREKQQTSLEEVAITKISLSMDETIQDHMVNKKRSPLNINFLEEDLRTILDTVKSGGFYFARFKTLDPSKILKYSNNYNKAILEINLNLEKKSFFDGVVITGNNKTDNDVIIRELKIKKGDILTPEKVALIKSRLASLGLFSLVQITPIVINKYEKNDSYLINLLIQVREKDFGVIEVAPGYRTDLGLKLSSAVIYNNISGKNRSLALKTQVNHRLSDFSNLDANRRSKEKKFVEFFAKLDFTEPFLFSSDLEAKTSLSYKRQKFFAFDADIVRFSPKLSKRFTDNVSTSLKYQLEKIRQYAATDVEKDNGVFTVGGITAAFSIDFRDSRILPRRGAYFGFSSEFANPTFLSTGSNQADNEVNFLKLTARSKFYTPLVFENWNMATSLSIGYQKNLGADFIPSIKVFRLDSVDVVRGFADDEANRLDMASNPDISEVIIDNSAYFLNFKIEPRYDLSDSMVLGFFFDAGRVFVNHFKPLSLRTAVGASFKFKTPVGTLDFDYGFKLKRRDVALNQRERVGRFHLSIGFF